MTEQREPTGRRLAVPGYEVGELLGYGASGEVWRGRCVSTGEEVALKRLRTLADPAARTRLGREAAVLAGLRSRHVVRLHGVVTAGTDLVLVLDLAVGGSLARAVAGRGPLSEGEVVTVGVPLAQALAELHDQGVIHGDVSPANVLFTAEGRPVLSDLGVARLIGAGRADLYAAPGFADPAGDGGPAGDVHGLAATCFAALTGQPPYDPSGVRRVAGVAGRVAGVLEAALHADPGQRPTAAEFAAALYEAAPARPVRLCREAGDAGPRGADLSLPTHVVARPAPAATGGTVPRRHHARPRRGSRWLRAGKWPLRHRLVVVLAGVAMGLAAAAGMAWAQSGSAAEPATVHRTDRAAGPAGVERGAGTEPVVGSDATPAGSDEWAQVLAQLDEARSAAYADGDVAALADVYSVPSAAGRADAAALGELLEAGLRAANVQTRVVSVGVVAERPNGVRLRVVDVLEPYQLRDDDGVLERRPGRGRTAWLVGLRAVTGTDPTGVGWRISELTRLGRP